MGFGFNLFFAFVLVPLTGVLCMLWIATRSRYLGWGIGLLWAGVFALVIVSVCVQAIEAKKELAKDDYYGEYVVDRSMFAGKDADWQYNTFRFEITAEDSIFFHTTRGAEIIRTYRGTISTVKPYSSERLVLHMEPPTHHILAGNPTIYRDSWGFFLVFLFSPLQQHVLRTRRVGST